MCRELAWAVVGGRAAAGHTWLAHGQLVKPSAFDCAGCAGCADFSSVSLRLPPSAAGSTCVALTTATPLPCTCASSPCLADQRTSPTCARNTIPFTQRVNTTCSWPEPATPSWWCWKAQATTGPSQEATESSFLPTRTGRTGGRTTTTSWTPRCGRCCLQSSGSPSPHRRRRRRLEAGTHMEGKFVHRAHLPLPGTRLDANRARRAPSSHHASWCELVLVRAWPSLGPQRAPLTEFRLVRDWLRRFRRLRQHACSRNRRNLPPPACPAHGARSRVRGVCTVHAFAGLCITRAAPPGSSSGGSTRTALIGRQVTGGCVRSTAPA